jgi:serine/threonine protein kinase
MITPSVGPWQYGMGARCTGGLTPYCHEDHVQRIMIRFSVDTAPGALLPPRFEVAEVKTVFQADHAKHLGTGGFGESWLLKQGHRHKVAKILYDANYPMAYLEREVKSLGRVDNSRVVRLLGLDLAALSVGPRAVLYFEYVDGDDVMTWLRTNGWPTEPEVLSFAAGLFEGLVALHEQEAVHRDLKPENIALRRSGWGEPVILDLGLAKLLDEPSITAYPALLGTAPYMAPEQLRGDRARKAADMWAAGIVLHLLLAREHPFYGPQPVAQDVALDLLEAGPPPLPETVGEPLRSIIPRLLSPLPYQRGSALRALGELEIVRR